MTESILSAPPFNLQHTRLPSINFKEWMLERAMQLQPELFAKLLMIIHGVWRNRNSTIWHNKTQSTQDLVLSSFIWLEEFTSIHVVSNKSNKLQQKTWKPVAQGSLTLNVDAAFLLDHHQGGIGGVLRDYQGRFKAAFACSIPYTASPKQCEMLAIRKGLDLLHSLQEQNVVVQSDLSEAIAEIQVEDHNLLANGGLIDDIKQIWQKLRGIQLVHTPRNCNQVAHRLVAIGFEATHAFVWLHHALDCILVVLNYDCNKLN
ncbi:uncharacterized protein LOC112184214 [Rosa chinensis]|uniref:uncharacterized protein LOC112184214 n=1 Tax=Rosa chinensis TaxID=74649 RepID=UPI000D087AAE|nr:uncharacterized protein LOC112184214 [Rosa chinensis]